LTALHLLLSRQSAGALQGPAPSAPLDVIFHPGLQALRLLTGVMPGNWRMVGEIAGLERRTDGWV
jgi:hypothetical protein